MAIRPFVLLLVALLALPATAQLAPREHPFLFLDAADLPALRQKARLPAFRPTVAAADEGWDEPEKPGDFKHLGRLLNFNLIRSALAPDAEARRPQVARLHDLISGWPERVPEMGHGHPDTVVASSALFTSIVALDLIGLDLSADALRDLEAAVGEAVAWFDADTMREGHPIPWKLAQQGVVTLWALYRQDAEAAAREVETYRHLLLDVSTNDDGTWVQSPGYAHARLLGERTAKSDVVHAIQRAGLFDFYGDAQMHALMDWVNAFSMTPFRSFTRFGETGLVDPKPADSSGLFTLGRYTERAGRMGRWHLGDLNAPPPKRQNAFLNLVLLPAEPPEPLMPASLLMPEGGGALWGRTGGREALQGVLLATVRESDDVLSFQHAAEDVNGLAVHAFGNLLLTNAGTRYEPHYPGQTPDGGAWTEGWMQNVVLVGGRERQVNGGKTGGAGLADGVVGTDAAFEFTTTDAGEALGNARHLRTLALVHATDDTPGYFLLLDDVAPDDPDDPVDLLLQPNTRAGSVRVVGEGLAYDAPADGFTTPFADGTESLRILFGTEPERVTIDTAWKAAFIQPVFRSARIVARHAAGPDGHARFLTALFAVDGGHPAPEARRFTGPGFSGVEVDAGPGVTDHAVATEAGSAEVAGVSLRGEAGWFRRRGGKLTDWAALRATRLRVAEGEGVGFTADRPVSVVVSGGHARVRCDGVTRIAFDGGKPVDLDAGTHRLPLP